MGLGEGSRGSAGNTWRRLGSELVVVELATAMVLLVGAALLGQSLYRLLHVDLAIPGRPSGHADGRSAGFSVWKGPASSSAGAADDQPLS